MRHLFFLFFSFFSFFCSATHIIGGYIHYEQISGTQYEITLTVYKDCQPFLGTGGDSITPIGFDNILGQPPVSPGLADAYLSIYTGNPGSGVLSEVPFTNLVITTVEVDDPDSCLNIPQDLCVQKGIYSVTVNLTDVIFNDIHISYQRCCRNPSSVNVNVDPFITGIAVATKIQRHTSFSSNSNPNFEFEPPLAFCLGNDISFDLSAIDLDGDSIAYELTTPLNGSGNGGPGASVLDPPYGLINYNSGYSGLEPIPGVPPLSLNAVSGLLTGAPNELGPFIIGIKVSEFRNGVLISETIRDIRIFIFDCGENQANFIVDDHICDGIDSIEFISFSSDVQFYAWDFGLPGNADTSNLEFPKYLYTQNGNYLVTFTANFGLECVSIDTHSFEFRNTIDVLATQQGPQCFDSNSFNFQITSFDFPDGTTLNWDFGQDAFPMSDTGFSPSNIHFETSGFHTVVLSASFGTCEVQSEIEIEVFPELEVDLPEIIIGCKDEEFTIAPTSINESYTYQWFIDDIEVSNEPSFILQIDSISYFDVRLIVKDGNGCTKTIEKENWLQVTELPIALFEIEDTSIFFGESFSITNLAQNYNSVLYEFGDGNSSEDDSPTHVYNDIGSYTIVQTVDNGGDCYDKYMLEIIVRYDHIIIFPNVFTPNDDDLNDTFYPLKKGIKSLSLEIYDRWGQKVYDGSQQKADHIWNGRYPDGKLADEEVYNYFCTYITELDAVKSTNGFVLLIK